MTDKNIFFIETLFNADIFLTNKKISFIFFMKFRIQTVYAFFKLEKLDGTSTNPQQKEIAYGSPSYDYRKTWISQG